MLPLIPALLLAVWLVHPWTLVDASTPQAPPPPHRLTMSAEAEGPRMLKLERAEPTPAPVTPSPTPVPTPSPTPTSAPTAPPTKAPAPTAIPRSALASAEIQALVCSYAWPCEEALRVMWCESGGLPWVIGRGSNYGLFQLNQVHARRLADFWTMWMDPATNIAWAYNLWALQGWKPWGCQP